VIEKARKAKKLVASGKVSDMKDDLFKLLMHSMYQEFIQNSDDRDVAEAMTMYSEMSDEEKKVFLELVCNAA